MKLSQLKKKYPKAFIQFNSFALYRYKNTKLNDNRDVRSEWLNITDFMDKQGIIITGGLYAPMEKKTDNLINGCVFDFKTSRFINTTYFKRKQAETKAICKAFEILEERL